MVITALTDDDLNCLHKHTTADVSGRAYFGLNGHLYRIGATWDTSNDTLSYSSTYMNHSVYCKCYPKLIDSRSETMPPALTELIVIYRKLDSFGSLSLNEFLLGCTLDYTI